MSVVNHRNGRNAALLGGAAAILANQGYRDAAVAIGRALGRGVRGAARAGMDWMQTPPTPRMVPGKFAAGAKRPGSRSKSRSGSKRVRGLRNSVLLSKSSGKFSAASKSFKKKRMVVLQRKNGVNHTAENTGSTIGNDAVWIGHVTFPVSQIYRQAIKTIFTEFMRRSNFDVVAETVSFNSVPDGSVINIDYRVTPVSVALSASFTFGATNDGVTLQAFVTWFTAAARPWAGLKDVVFWKMYWTTAVAGAPKCDMVLNTFLVELEVKSTLKIQNRTADADGLDATDDVDVTPLYGKFYEANGTYLKTRKNNVDNGAAPINISGDPFTGTVVKVDDDSFLKEPPQGKVEFSNCKAVGKAHLEPGEIKTSTLVDNFKMYFSTIHQMVVPLTGLPTVPVFNTNSRERMMGKLRVFCLEKMLNVGNQVVNIAYEHNYEISASGRSKRTYGVVKSFERNVTG